MKPWDQEKEEGRDEEGCSSAVGDHGDELVF